MEIRENILKGKGIVGDAFDSGFDGEQKFISKAMPPLLIPTVGAFEILLSFRTDDKSVCHVAEVILAITSCQGEPESGSL